MEGTGGEVMTADMRDCDSARTMGREKRTAARSKGSEEHRQ